MDPTKKNTKVAGVKTEDDTFQKAITDTNVEMEVDITQKGITETLVMMKVDTIIRGSSEGSQVKSKIDTKLVQLDDPETATVHA